MRAKMSAKVYDTLQARHIALTLLLCVAMTTADTSSMRECMFTLHTMDFQPSITPALVLNDVSKFSFCAHACLGRLGLGCQGVGYLPDQRECRLYTVFNASDVTVVSPGFKFYKGCNMSTSSCQAYRDVGAGVSGMYLLDVEELGSPLPVFCDMTSDGGGWTVFQRRQNGSVDFYRDWADYREGFGDVMGEHWLGNAALHALTKGQGRQLRVELQAWDDVTAWAHYSTFLVAAESASFQLTLTGYSGTAGDSMAPNNGYRFTTWDRDNDILARGNCAESWGGGWWYKWCGGANPNGPYRQSAQSGWNTPFWNGFKGTVALRFIEMKLR